MKNNDQKFVNKTKELEIIENIVKTNRLVFNRTSKLQALGFEVQELPMGSGGVLQKKKMASGQIRVQIGYGHGKHNYAMTVIL